MPRIREMLRRTGVATMTPLKFAYASGHFRSSMRGRAEDPKGRPRPWYTYPAVDYLETFDFSDCDVCEFGSGQSTLWWADRCKRLVAVEESEDWYRRVAPRVRHLPNVEYHLEATPDRYAAKPADQEFDVVVIDGGDRLACARTALQTIRPDGLVILDNSEGSWGAGWDHPIIDLLEEHGYARVDFHGFAAGVWQRQCTSLFFRDHRRLVGLQPPRRVDSAA
jgi:Methyltransferase domain